MEAQTPWTIDMINSKEWIRLHICKCCAREYWIWFVNIKIFHVTTKLPILAVVVTLWCRCWKLSKAGSFESTQNRWGFKVSIQLAWMGWKVSVELPALAVLYGFVSFKILVGPKSVHRTAKVSSCGCTVRKVSIELQALAVLLRAYITANLGSCVHTFLCGQNFQRWQFWWHIHNCRMWLVFPSECL